MNTPDPATPSGSDIDVAALRQCLSALGTESPDLVLLSDAEDRLYHYTDLNALTSILSDSDLWLTNSRFSNDAEEIAYGERLARRVTKRLRDKGDDAALAAFLDKVLELLDPEADPQVANAAYICCFCEKPNLLSQWRGYGSNGLGVAMEINPAAFSAVAGPDCPIGLMRFWRVYYEVEKQEQLIERVIHYWYGCEGAETPEMRARKVVDGIRFFIPTFKNADFSEEREWRLIFTPGKDCPVRPRFRTRGGMLVPYYSLRDIAKTSGAHWPQLPITHLCIGPGPSRTLNVESVGMLLAQHQYGHVPVEASQTPYRAG